MLQEKRQAGDDAGGNVRVSTKLICRGCERIGYRNTHLAPPDNNTAKLVLTPTMIDIAKHHLFVPEKLEDAQKAGAAQHRHAERLHER